MKNPTITDPIMLRLKEVLDEKNIAYSDFGKLINLDWPQTMETRMYSKSAKKPFLDSVIKHLPDDINPTWVLEGYGDKYINKSNNYKLKLREPDSNYYGKGIISHYETVDDLILHFREGTEPATTFTIPGLQGHCISFYYKGYNMYPTILEDDLLVCAQVETPDIIDDYMYVVKARYDRTITLCRVYQYNDGDVLELHPDNADKTHYNIIRVSRKDVEFILKVRGRFTRKLAKYVWYLP